MAELGKGYINVVPKFPGLANSITGALSGVDTTRTGEKIGGSLSQGMGNGLVKSGAVIGAFSAIANKAITAVSSNVDSAISRFDTLNNYPRVMQSLGYSADEADASIEKVSDRLLGLPTTLDSMVSTIQGLSVITKDLDLATESGLALNDMLLASGSSQQLVTAAQEQFRQMLSKGKPDMQDWKSLVQAMPGQLDQLAKSMLGPKASANDLYAALGGGKNKVIFTMDDLLKQIVKLDKEGGAGFASFEEQARKATGGVQTSMTNVNTAIARGMSNIMEEIGQENIAGAFSDLKDGINEGFGAATDFVKEFKPELQGLYDLTKQVGPVALTAGAGYLAFSKGYGVVDGLVGRVSDLYKKTKSAENGLGLLGAFKLNPAAMGITAGITILGVLGAAAYKAYREHEQLNNATSGLAGALANTSALDSYNERIASIGTSAGGSKKSVEELISSISEHSNRIQETNKTAQAQIGTLNTARDVINQYAGQTDLSNDAQGRLKWAIQQVNEQLGLNISELDVANGHYTDQNGKVQDLTKSVDDLVEAKKREIQINALSSNLQEAYESINDQTSAIVQQRKEVERLKALGGNETWGDAQTQKDYAEAVGKLAQLESGLDDTKKAAKNLEDQLGDTSKTASDSADSFDKLANHTSVWYETLKDKGHTLSGLKTDLQALGIDTEKFAKLSEDQLLQVVDAYDGSAISIVEALSKVGMYVSQDNEALARNAKSITDALNGMDLSKFEQLNGIDLDDLGLKLAQAGADISTLAEEGAESFAALAERCGYDFDLMVAAITTYNNTEIVDQYGNITIEQTTLLDAQGNIYTWNGTRLEDKFGNAVVDDKNLMDAHGHVVEWNGSELKALFGSANVTGNLKNALADAQSWNNMKLKDQFASAYMTITRSVVDIFNQPHASGGIRLHAAGAIATKATPLDIVGEDGAEAIVPLTNRKYSQPFIDLIAEGVADKAGMGSTVVNNIYLNGMRVNDDAAIQDAAAGFIKQLTRRKDMIHGRNR